MPNDTPFSDKYEENFDDEEAQDWNLGDWRLEYKQVFLDGYIYGLGTWETGNYWAYHKKGNWFEDNFYLSFKVDRLKGTVHANFHINERGRYVVGLDYNVSKAALTLFLARVPLEFRGPIPTTEYLASVPLPHNADHPHKVEITTDSGNIVVKLDDYEWISYNDPDPLPGGTIAFENIRLENWIDDIIVIGASGPTEDDPRIDSIRTIPQEVQANQSFQFEVVLKNIYSEDGAEAKVRITCPSIDYTVEAGPYPGESDGVIEKIILSEPITQSGEWEFEAKLLYRLNGDQDFVKSDSKLFNISVIPEKCPPKLDVKIYVGCPDPVAVGESFTVPVMLTGIYSDEGAEAKVRITCPSINYTVEDGPYPGEPDGVIEQDISLKPLPNSGEWEFKVQLLYSSRDNADWQSVDQKSFKLQVVEESKFDSVVQIIVAGAAGAAIAGVGVYLILKRFSH
jgi:hypothetical protein